MAQPQQRPAIGVVRFYNFLSDGHSFLDEVLAGLARPRKTLPSRHLHDARGRELYEKRCELPGYTPARSELAILREQAGAVGKFLGPDCQLIEFGRGSGANTRVLVEQLQPPLYVPIDVEDEAMRAAAKPHARRFPARTASRNSRQWRSAAVSSPTRPGSTRPGCSACMA